MLLGAVFAGGFALTSALGRGSAPAPVIVVDKSIGGVAIGMTQADVEAVCGRPFDSFPIMLRGGGTGLLAKYHANGGVLIVEYADGLVVSIETSSPAFRTDGGVGPGASKGGVHGFHQDAAGSGTAPVRRSPATSSPPSSSPATASSASP